MSIFNRNKKNNEPAPVQKSAAPSSPKPIVDADDFFKDLDKKSKPKEVSFEVETPEVTGLREAPLPRPVSEINMVETDEAAAEALADKTAMVLGDEYGDINAVNVSVDTDEVLPDKTLQERTYIPFEIPEEEEAKPEFDPLDPDAFFRDIDRSKRRNKVKTTIEAPEVTGTSLLSSFMVASVPYLVKDIVSVVCAYFIALAVKKALRKARLGTAD